MLDAYIAKLCLMLVAAVAVAYWAAAGTKKWHDDGRQGSEALWMLCGPYGWPAVSSAFTQFVCVLLLPLAPAIGAAVWHADAVIAKWRRAAEREKRKIRGLIRSCQDIQVDLDKPDPIHRRGGWR